MPLPTIAEKGGLQVHLPERGIDYTVFSQQVEAEISAAAISRYWTKLLKKSIHERAVSKYIKIYKEEKMKQAYLLYRQDCIANHLQPLSYVQWSGSKL